MSVQFLRKIILLESYVSKLMSVIKKTILLESSWFLNHDDWLYFHFVGIFVVSKCDVCTVLRKIIFVCNLICDMGLNLHASSEFVNSRFMLANALLLFLMYNILIKNFSIFILIMMTGYIFIFDVCLDN